MEYEVVTLTSSYICNLENCFDSGTLQVFLNSFVIAYSNKIV